MPSFPMLQPSHPTRALTHRNPLYHSEASPSKRLSVTVDKHQRLLSLALDHILDTATEALSVDSVYVTLCMRLSEGQEQGGAVGFLTACYKRLVAKSNASNSDKLKDDLDEYVMFNRVYCVSVYVLYMHMQYMCRMHILYANVCKYMQIYAIICNNMQ